MLTAICGVALGLYLFAIGQGLPYIVHPDEGFEIHRALKLGNGEFNFDRTLKGGFFYILFVEYAAYFAWLWLTGQISSPSDFLVWYGTDPTPFWLIGRVTTALISVLVVASTFFLGKHRYGGRVGLIGAAVTALSVLLVSKSHFVNVDIPMTLLVLCTLILAHRWADPAEKCRPVLLGAVFALAVMTKAPAIVVLLPIAVANWLRHRDATWRQRLFGREILLAYFVAAIVYIAGNPGVVLRFTDVFSAARRLLLGVGSGADLPDIAGADGPGANLWLFYWNALIKSLGLGMLVLSLCGMVYGFFRRERADILLLAFAVPYFALIASAHTGHLYYDRYLIPLIPLLGLMAGRAILVLLDRWNFSSKKQYVVAAAAVALLLVPTTLRSLDWLHRWTRGDTRLHARAWIESNVPAGTPILLMGIWSMPETSHSVPLRNLERNLDPSLMDPARKWMRNAELSKPHYLEKGVPYDLHLVKLSQAVKPLVEYEREAIAYFILEKRFFHPDKISRDMKLPQRVLESRLDLYKQLNSHARVKKVFEIDPESDTLNGPGLEVYQLQTETSMSLDAPREEWLTLNTRSQDARPNKNDNDRKFDSD